MRELRMAVVHLDRRTAEVITPEQDLVRESVGGAALNLALIGRYGTSIMVFGAGPLTGTFAPASALLVASFAPGEAAEQGRAAPAAGMAESASAAAIRHVPLLLTAGPDFRCSGIDHLVLLGAAEEPTLIHIDGGLIRFLEPPKPAADLPTLGRMLRRASPPFRSAVLTSPAADAGIPFASVSIGLKGSLDKAGLAGAMATKNLKGILFGGSGGIGFANQDLSRSLEIAGKIRPFRKRAGGFDTVLKAIGGENERKAFSGAKIQEAACFHCPAPCMVHARFNAVDPRPLRDPKKQAGVLLMDHAGWVALARKRSATALPLLSESIRLGLDPCVAALLLSPAGGIETLASDFALLQELAKGVHPSPPTSASAAAADLTFGGSPLLSRADEEARRQTALAFVLGLCPIFLQRFPSVSGDLPAFLPDVPPASLDRAVKSVLDQR